MILQFNNNAKVSKEICRLLKIDKTSGLCHVCGEAKNKNKQTKTKTKNKTKTETKQNLSPFIFNFPPLPFQIFLLFLSIFPFFLAPFFPVGQQKFPRWKCQGALCPLPPPPPPPRYATAEQAIVHATQRKLSGEQHRLRNYWFKSINLVYRN